MSSGAPTTLFLICSPSDVLADTLAKELAKRYQVVTGTTLIGSGLRGDAVRQAMESTNLVLVVVPPAGDRGRQAVLFDSGIAHGLGRPIIVAVHGKGAFNVLRDFPTISLDDYDSFLDVFESVAARVVENGIHHVPTRLASDSVWDFLGSPGDPRLPSASQRYSRMGGMELAHSVRAMLAEAGAIVQMEESLGAHGSAVRADMVLWHDDLLSAFGLPIPVEVVLHGNDLSKLRARLAATLKLSGARSLIAVSRDEHVGQRWTSQGLLILSVSADDLGSALKAHPIAVAFSRLLGQARPL